MAKKPDPMTDAATENRLPAHDQVFCYHKGVPYSPGSQECMGGFYHVCRDNGTWSSSNGAQCKETGRNDRI